MIRLHLSADDVANVRFRPEPCPMDDTAVIVRHMLSGRRPLHPRLDPARMAVLTDLVGRCTPGFICSPSASLDAGLEGLMSAPARLLARDLDDVTAFGEPVPVWAPQLLERRSARRLDVAAAYRHVYGVMIEPYAPLLDDHHLRAHQQHVTRLAADGLAAVLNHLHPSIRWTSPVLSIDLGGNAEFDVHLDGRGLTLRPSAHDHDPSVMHDEDGAFDTTVVYPITGTARTTEDLPRVAPAALAAVLGQTRANALAYLARNAGATTGALAQGMDVSAASASEQLTLLRAAGLTRRVRRGPAVSHSLTQLGWSLLAAARPAEPVAAPP